MLTAVALAPLVGGFRPARAAGTAEVEQGNAALKAGKAEDALAHYDKAVAKLPGRPGRPLRSRRRAVCRCRVSTRRRQEFLRATQAQDRRPEGLGLFNLGNAFSKKDKYKEAVEAYKRALALHPTTRRAKWNLEIALASRRQDEKKKQDQKDKDDKNKRQGQGQETRRQGPGQAGRQGQEEGRRQEEDQATRTRTRRTSKDKQEQTRQKDKDKQDEASRSPRQRGRQQPSASRRCSTASRQLQGSREGAGPAARGTPAPPAKDWYAGVAESSPPRRSRSLVPLAGLLAARPAGGRPRPSFVAALDRAAAAPGEPFVYEVTLTLGDQPFEDFRPPDFRGLTVVSAPGTPRPGDVSADGGRADPGGKSAVLALRAGAARGRQVRGHHRGRARARRRARPRLQRRARPHRRRRRGSARRGARARGRPVPGRPVPGPRRRRFARRRGRVRPRRRLHPRRRGQAQAPTWASR